MTFDEVLTALRSVKYRWIKGMTIAPNGCMCAIGALLQYRGFAPVPSESLRGQFLPNLWKKDGGTFHIRRFEHAANLLGLPMTLCQRIESYSDLNRMPGPRIADTLEMRRAEYEEWISAYQKDRAIAMEQ